jgi:predicted RNA-binding Zn ribbon-like protein
MAEGDRHELEFDFSGGLLCLDFANTVSGRARERPKEQLNLYSDLVSWGREARLVTDLEAQRLLREARRRPGEAASVLERAVMLREGIFRIFSAVADGRSPDDADLAVLNAALSEALSWARIVQTPEGFAWDWADRGERLEQLIWPIARSAAELLTSPDLSRVRECAETGCAWLFHDTSRNRSRQWCDMKVCGNRAKARRHYARMRSAR